ncbi:MAG: hypothetical protein PT120_16465 [Aphanizomenon gracile PMC649.10]|nr:hypothetical protein [Aphanizomenon gracile PMC638.10]MDM3856436.1 hypothetical protein [Aphanizomenon gracile PMC649.10]
MHNSLIQGKIQVKAHPEKKIHAKVYILRPEPFNQHTPATAITGSSNLTEAGLGGGNFYNYINKLLDKGWSQEEIEKDIERLSEENPKNQTFKSTDFQPSFMESLDEVKLFSGTYQEEQDERLKFLYFLRNFRKKHKAWFDKITKMPLKSRVGRNSTTIKKPDLQNGTVAFLKTDKKFEFYWIDSHNQPKEITPLAAFKIFEAEENEKNGELIPNHHDHVNKAIEYFENLEHKLVQSQIDPEALGGVAQNAKKFLF